MPDKFGVRLDARATSTSCDSSGVTGQSVTSANLRADVFLARGATCADLSSLRLRTSASDVIHVTWRQVKTIGTRHVVVGAGVTVAQVKSLSVGGSPLSFAMSGPAVHSASFSGEQVLLGVTPDISATDFAAACNSTGVSSLPFTGLVNPSVLGVAPAI